MAFEKEKQFLEKMMADEALRAKVEAADPEQIAEIIKAAGFDFTAEDLENAARELRAKADPEMVSLSVDELDEVAGGTLWRGEDGSDGHEMGCSLTYHTWGWSKTHNEWCKSSWFCQGGYYGKPKMDDDFYVD